MTTRGFSDAQELKKRMAGSEPLKIRQDVIQ